MKIILSEKLPRILKNKKRLEKILNVKISNRGKEIIIEGEPDEEYIAEKVLDALNFGFPFSDAMLIKKYDCTFEILNIKNFTKRKDFKTIRARIIGTHGKTLKTLCDLTRCSFELNENQIGIIGEPECIKNAEDAITKIIQGSKQTNVYHFLEKRQVKEPIDLGLKK